MEIRVRKVSYISLLSFFQWLEDENNIDDGTASTWLDAGPIVGKSLVIFNPEQTRSTDSVAHQGAGAAYCSNLADSNGLWAYYPNTFLMPLNCISMSNVHSGAACPTHQHLTETVISQKEKIDPNIPQCRRVSLLSAENMDTARNPRDRGRTLKGDNASNKKVKRRSRLHHNTNSIPVANACVKTELSTRSHYQTTRRVSLLSDSFGNVLNTNVDEIGSYHRASLTNAYSRPYDAHAGCYFGPPSTIAASKKWESVETVAPPPSFLSERENATRGLSVLIPDTFNKTEGDLMFSTATINSCNPEPVCDIADLNRPPVTMSATHTQKTWPTRIVSVPPQSSTENLEKLHSCNSFWNPFQNAGPFSQSYSGRTDSLDQQMSRRVSVLHPINGGKGDTPFSTPAINYYDPHFNRLQNPEASYVSYSYPYYSTQPPCEHGQRDIISRRVSLLSSNLDTRGDSLLSWSVPCPDGSLSNASSNARQTNDADSHRLWSESHYFGIPRNSSRRVSIRYAPHESAVPDAYYAPSPHHYQPTPTSSVDEKCRRVSILKADYTCHNMDKHESQNTSDSARYNGPCKDPLNGPQAMVPICDLKLQDINGDTSQRADTNKKTDKAPSPSKLRRNSLKLFNEIKFSLSDNSLLSERHLSSRLDCPVELESLVEDVDCADSHDHLSESSFLPSHGSHRSNGSDNGSTFALLSKFQRRSLSDSSWSIPYFYFDDDCDVLNSRT